MWCNPGVKSQCIHLRGAPCIRMINNILFDDFTVRQLYNNIFLDPSVRGRDHDVSYATENRISRKLNPPKPDQYFEKTIFVDGHVSRNDVIKNPNYTTAFTAAA